MQLGDHVRINGCGCTDHRHAWRHGIVTALDPFGLALEVLLNEPHPFPEPPDNEVCAWPRVLELLP